MANSKGTAVQPALSTELTPELVAFVEDTALRDDHPLAQRARKVLRLLRAGKPLAAIESELRPIILAFVGRAPGTDAAPDLQTTAAGGGAPAVLKSLTVQWNQPVLALARLLAAVAPQPAPVPNPAWELDALGRKLFLSVKEASVYAGLPESTIRRLIAQQTLPAVKAGGWRIQRRYLEVLAPRHLRQVGESNF